MAGLKIEKQELLTVRGSDGSEVKIDDIVVIRTYRDEDVLCRFKGMQIFHAAVERLGQPEHDVNSAAVDIPAELLQVPDGFHWHSGAVRELLLRDAGADPRELQLTVMDFMFYF